MGSIVWLASYPKSGNTWVRVFLTNYFRDAREPASINDLEGGPIASSRRLFDELVGVEASDCSADLIARCRIEMYRRYAEDLSGTGFVKVHDAFRRLSGAPLFPLDVTAGAIYIIRNPADVAVSLAHHFSCSFDDAVDRVCRGFTIASNGDRLKEQLEQVLLSWSEHVYSWLDAPGLNVHVVRFEDLLATPQRTFAGIVRAAGLPFDEERLDRALQFSTFQQLRQQENAAGFHEKPAGASAFFRSGRSGESRTILERAQTERIVAAHGDTMRRLGYSSEG